MFKIAATLMLCAVTFESHGCQQNRPDPVAPEVAMKRFNDQVQNHCAGKQIDPEKLNEFAKDYRNDADTQSQQLIDLNTSKLCGKSGGAECYNQGFVQAEVQMGGIDDIVKLVCAMK